MYRGAKKNSLGIITILAWQLIPTGIQKKMGVILTSLTKRAGNISVVISVIVACIFGQILLLKNIYVRLASSSVVYGRALPCAKKILKAQEMNKETYPDT